MEYKIKKGKLIETTTISKEYDEEQINQMIEMLEKEEIEITDKLKEWVLTCESISNLEINDKKVTPEDIYSLAGLMDLFVELKLAYRNETVIDKKK